MNFVILFCVAADSVDPAQIKNALLYIHTYAKHSMKKWNDHEYKREGNIRLRRVHHITFHLTGIEERSDNKIENVNLCDTRSVLISMLSHRFPSTF